jgi:hypothetical protein
MVDMKHKREPKKPEERGWVGRLLYKVIGPATVERPLQGHSPEAQEQWKRLVEARKRAREEQRRKQR